MAESMDLKDPYVIIEDGPNRLLMERGNVFPEFDNTANAVQWSPRRGYSEPKPLQVWLKFLYGWSEPIPYAWKQPQ